jgi:hypothetical protein
MGWPDMRLPIMYTMSWPERVMASEKTWPRLDFLKMGDLTFRQPDNKKYPAMDLAYAAGRMGGTMTGVLSAANEQVGQLLLLLLVLLVWSLASGAAHARDVSRAPPPQHSCTFCDASSRQPSSP